MAKYWDMTEEELTERADAFGIPTHSVVNPAIPKPDLGADIRFDKVRVINGLMAKDEARRAYWLFWLSLLAALISIVTLAGSIITLTLKFHEIVQPCK